MGSHRVGHDWSDLAAEEAKIIIVSEVSPKRKTNTIWYHLYMESSKKERKRENELICKT